MADMDELSTATEGLAMDTESNVAVAADEVEPTTNSATDGGDGNRGEPRSNFPRSRLSEVLIGATSLPVIATHPTLILAGRARSWRP